MIRVWYGLTACISHFTIYQQLNSWVISDLQSAQEIELHAQFDGHYLCGRPLDPHQHTAIHMAHFPLLLQAGLEPTSLMSARSKASLLTRLFNLSIKSDGIPVRPPYTSTLLFSMSSRAYEERHDGDNQSRSAWEIPGEWAWTCCRYWWLRAFRAEVLVGGGGSGGNFVSLSLMCIVCPLKQDRTGITLWPIETGI